MVGTEWNQKGPKGRQRSAIGQGRGLDKTAQGRPKQVQVCTCTSMTYLHMRVTDVEWGPRAGRAAERKYKAVAGRGGSGPRDGRAVQKSEADGYATGYVG